MGGVDGLEEARGALVATAGIDLMPDVVAGARLLEVMIAVVTAAAEAAVMLHLVFIFTTLMKQII